MAVRAVEWRMLSGAGVLLALPLMACGGGSGTAPATVTTTPPVTTPTPTPTPVNYDTAEYRRSGAAVASGAITAWNQGYSGAGITAAVIDSGLNPASAEFAGRIHPASRDIASNRVLGDEGGHGSSVTGVLAAARNDSGIMGVAWGATILMLKADTPGSCGADGCSYSGTTIASGIDIATSTGARVVNISLGGPSAGTSVRNAALRAAANGTVLVLAAGNESLASPEGLAQGVVAAAPATTIIVGALDASRNAASFTNNAGVLANNTLFTLGVSVRSFNQDGTAFLYSGTSIATPVVSGAVALLAQAFPTLTGAQIVDILFRSADDLGAPGVDPIYGRGALNITRAMSPIGGLNIPGTTSLVTLGGSLSAPLGDGGTAIGALSGVRAEDSYGRGYSVNLAGTLRQAAPGRLAMALLSQPVQSASIASPNGMVQFGWQGDMRGQWAGDRATGAALAMAARPAPPPTGQVRLQLAGGTEVALGQGVGLVGMAGGQAAAGGLIGNGMAGLGLVPGASASLMQRQGDWHWGLGMASATLMAERGINAATAASWQAEVGRQWGALAVTGLLAFASESGSLAGARLSPGFGISGADTMALGLSAQWAAGPWALAGDMRMTQTRARLRPGLVAAMGPLNGSSWQLALLRRGALQAGDQLTLRLGQPWALAGMVQWAGSDAPLRLGPSARESLAALDYDVPLDHGSLGFSLFHRQQPGNIAAAPDDMGGAVRLRLAW